MALESNTRRLTSKKKIKALSSPLSAIEVEGILLRKLTSPFEHGAAPRFLKASRCSPKGSPGAGPGLRLLILGIAMVPA